MGANTAGHRNTAMGQDALANNTTGAENTAIGNSALVANTTGNQNTAVGGNCLDECTTGVENTAVGYGDANNLTTAAYNTAIGYNASRDLTTGNDNTTLGINAGLVLSTGSNNLILGTNSGRSTSPSGDITTGSNNVVLGDNGINNLYCADTSISSSDSRDKTDVSDFSIGLTWIKALRPVTYRWDRRTWYGTDEEPFGTPDGSKKRTRLHIGFLAQEALEVEKSNGYGSSNDDSLIVNLTDDGMSYGMKYERLVPILVNAIKELSTKNDALETRIKTLESKLN